MDQSSTKDLSVRMLKKGIMTSLFDGQFEDSAREYQIHLLTNDKHAHILKLQTSKNENFGSALS